MPIVTLKTPQRTSLCEIDSAGASIARLQLNGQEILWSGTRPDGGKGITHPCIPNFNIADGLPNHGPARKAEWTQLTPNSFHWIMEEIPPHYPHGLEVTRQFEIGENFLRTVTTLMNKSDKDIPINVAEHHYFACEPAKRAEVTVNGVLFDQGGLEGTAKYLPLSGDTLQIEIPNKPKIVLQVKGYGAYAQWSQPNADFVCVEPIQILPPTPEHFITEAPKLQAGETKVFEWELRVWLIV